MHQNTSRQDTATTTTLHGCFEARVAATPRAIALRYRDRTLTFGELNGKANQLARHVQSQGVGPDVLTAVVLPRSSEAIVAILGILKAGGACLVLDPSHHPEGIASILDDARPFVTLTSTTLKIRLPRMHRPVLYLDPTLEQIAEYSADDDTSRAGADNVAFVAYEIGAGRALKGLMVTHGGACAALRAYSEPAVGDEVFALCRPLTTPASLMQVFDALVSGATVAIVPDDHMTDAKGFLWACGRDHVTSVDLPPALVRKLADLGTTKTSELESLRTLTVPAGVMTTATSEALVRLVPHARIRRCYELPDDGACVDLADATEAGPGQIIARAPFGGAPIAVLGADLRPMAEGAAGEVYFRGPLLPRGYLGRAWPTAERFVADPAGHGDVLYRTGELGRTLPNGGIEFLGPVDTVTWQGRRVVLGEIEMVLREATGVRDAAAALRRVGERDELVAYVVATSGGRSVVDLKADVQSRLPSHLCPTTFVALERLPHTPSGQLDRAALPSPDPILRPVEQPYAPPQNAVEAALVEIWAEVLLLDRVGIHDDFLDIGGDSLLAMQIAGRIWDQFAREIPLQTFFEQCTIASVAQDYLTDAVEAAEEASAHPH